MVYRAQHPIRSVGPYCKNAPTRAQRVLSPSLSANIDRHNFDLDGQIFPEDHPRAVDCGDLPYDEDNFQANRENIFLSIKSNTLQQNSIPIVIGGDDSIPIPVLQAFEGERRNIRYCKSMPISIGGNLIWMKYLVCPLLCAVHQKWTTLKRIIQVGSRGLGSAHSDDLADALEWGVNLFTAYEVHNNGISRYFRKPYRSNQT